jgi:hypothetical protein
VVERIIELRTKLSEAGLDAGPDTIGWHLSHHGGVKVSSATISRYLTKAGLVTPAPEKRPRSSYIRFEADQPNECWQSDSTHDFQARQASVLRIGRCPANSHAPQCLGG